MLEHTFNTHNELITHKQALIIVPTTEEGLLLQSLLGGKKKKSFRNCNTQSGLPHAPWLLRKYWQVLSHSIEVHLV